LARLQLSGDTSSGIKYLKRATVSPVMLPCESAVEQGRKALPLLRNTQINLLHS
jgi:hypothetical protein